MGSKGEATRQAILDRAFELARQVGLEGLTIGRLADDLDLSKSGLFAHFQSKEALQVQVLESAAARFVDHVVRPALATRRGEPRVRAIFERWIAWAGLHATPGGCFFVHAAAELDDREGAARDWLVQLQREWLDVIATSVSGAVQEGHFKASVDPEQFAYDLNGIILAYHHAARLLRDHAAESRARRAFDALVDAATAPRATTIPKASRAAGTSTPARRPRPAASSSRRQ